MLNCLALNLSKTMCDCMSASGVVLGLTLTPALTPSHHSWPVTYNTTHLLLPLVTLQYLPVKHFNENFNILDACSVLSVK